MDKLEKFLKKLSTKELQFVSEAIEQLLSAREQSLDIKKLKGFEDIYRARVRDIRIIYRSTDGRVTLIEISRRSEKTYKDF